MSSHRNSNREGKKSVDMETMYQNHDYPNT